ncbi:MAG: nitrophenyl compound nitroreductase subunit ArsF family protein [Bacteroidetes bacterium]|nr:nitrophenyl compound nitroreductase subunit ArsF family protein [Bacteroidota bacterium]
MRKFLILISLMLFSCFSLVTVGSISVPGNNNPVLEVYYFHGTYRCPTCLSIEENTINTIDTYFKNELDNGTIRLKILNFDDKENKSLVEKYEVYGSTLLLIKIADGKEIKEDMTNFAFSYSRNEREKFIGGLKDKITEMLK